MAGRAAQFASFAALAGYGEAVAETARRTERKRRLSEEKAEELDRKTHLLIEHACERPLISVEYFVPDSKKSGGAYHVAKGVFRRYDEYDKSIVLCDGTRISTGDIFNIFGEFFAGYGHLYNMP